MPMSFSIIEPTGHNCDLLDSNGHRHVGQIDPEQVGVRDFYVEHGLTVTESELQNVRDFYVEHGLDAIGAKLEDDEVADLFLSQGQADEELVLPATDGRDDPAGQDPEELVAEETDWGTGGMLNLPHTYKH